MISVSGVRVEALVFGNDEPIGLPLNDVLADPVAGFLASLSDYGRALGGQKVDDRFASHVDKLPRMFASLEAFQPEVVQTKNLPSSPSIYVLWEGKTAMHVGRARNLRNRVRGHHGSSHTTAALAFNLTRQSTGQLKASYRKEGSRRELMADPVFAADFSRQSTRVKLMKISYLVVPDPIDQYLLELYTALRLGTSLLEFDTH